MSDEIKVRTMPVSEVAPASRGGSSKNPWIILVVVVLVLGVLGFLFRDKLMNKPADKMTADAGKSSGYQAVFLTNGQVYFGKLSMVNGDYAKLTDIYYLQVTNPPQLQGAGAQQNAQAQQPQIQLVKLGNELHGPVDVMQINRSQILFYEDMKDDGKVMEAIHTNQKTPPAAPATQAPAGGAPATQTPAPAPVK